LLQHIGSLTHATRQMCTVWIILVLKWLHFQKNWESLYNLLTQVC